MRPLENFARDMRHAMRQLTRSRGFSLMAVLTLALGSAPTRPSSASSKPCSCVRFRINTLKGSSWSGRLTPPITTQAHTLTAIANSTRSGNRAAASKSSPPSPGQRAPGRFCDRANLSTCLPSPRASTSFPCLVCPRNLAVHSPRKISRVAALSYLPTTSGPRKLGAPADIVGRSLSFRNASCVVIGVMPKTFSFYPVVTDAWSLITTTGEFAHKPWNSMTGVFGLLRPGVTRAAAESELTAIQASVLPEASPDLKIMRTWLPTFSTCNRTSSGSPAATSARDCGFSSLRRPSYCSRPGSTWAASCFRAPPPVVANLPCALPSAQPSAASSSMR